jgi:MFS family permease
MFREVPHMANSTEIKTDNTGNAFQGWILVSAAWLSTMANQVVSPILPRMTQHFSNLPSVDLLISLAATLPALFVAILAIPAGILADRFGHKRLLFSTVLIYGLVGTAPLWLKTLQQIVISRAFVGIAEAAIMTCSTALIGAYFIGSRRERYLALQTGTAPIVAIICTWLGGTLGEANWRNAYMIYFFAFLLIPLTGFFIKEPSVMPHGDSAPAQSSEKTSEHFSWSILMQNWGKLIGICLITVFAMTAFLVTIIQLSFVLTERGVDSPLLIGRWASIAMFANPLGALLFTLIPWRPVPKLSLAFFLFSCGFFIISISSAWQPAIAGAIIANLGAGMILPTLITWALTTISPEQRGTGTGAWQAANFLGQFLSPLIVLALKRTTGSLSSAILVYAIVCCVFGFIALAGAIRLKKQIN